jgi:Dipeptidyl aminopeptidases/acylaminoacyl-peptidases
VVRIPIPKCCETGAWPASVRLWSTLRNVSSLKKLQIPHPGRWHGCPGLNLQNGRTVERCKAPSTDGVDIQYFFMKPSDSTGPVPTLFWIHGGPIGMDADGWHWRWNPLLAVAAGYAVVMPNPRGSTGFGQEFIQGIWGNVWGDQCFRDLMCVADAIEARSDVDSKRIMAMGGSFGGYMTNWIGTQTDRFRCLITHASISPWLISPG